MALKACEKSACHRAPIFRVVLLAVQTTRGKGQRGRVTLRKTVGHFCSECLLSREFTVQGRDLLPGAQREA
jgi:hypothetical protein